VLPLDVLLNKPSVNKNSRNGF